MNIKIIWGVLLLFGFIFYSGSVMAKDISTTNAKAIENDLPIEIVSNRLDAYHEKKLVVFSGDAVATQGDMTIKADQLLIYYKENQQIAEGDGSTGMERRRDLEKIEVKGHVTVIQGDRVVSGDDAVFYNNAQKIAMTGNAVMREGNNVIRGETIVVYLKENRGVVEGAENKRVRATIYPKKDEEK